MSKPAVIVTFVRHGESTDNLRDVWAGWADAPLSQHGMNQARALGESLKDVPFAAIHASDLKRATSTAQALQAAQAAQPKPPLTRSALLREQNFGIAEGKRWAVRETPGMSLEEHYAQGIFPVLSDPAAKYPEGESLHDLFARAERAVRELVMPHVWTAARAGARGVHIAVVSHGLCISRLVPALLQQGTAPPGRDYSGLKNTAWTRVKIELKDDSTGAPLEFDDANPPSLALHVADVNQHEHLTGVKRQAGGIGSASHDPAQADIRAFFGGAKAGTAPAQGVDALEHSRSNVEDQPEKVVEQNTSGL